ncbi:MAG: T9SS type A sorting domain-containing protein [Bacteroidia bacterium]
MRILINKIVLLFSLSLICNLLYSQGLVENELITNQVLVKKYNELKSRALLKTPSIADTLTLGPKGILDDFSYDGPYPDTSLWLDNYVFINRDFAKSPITLGVATFDGLDNTGYPYDFSAAPSSSGQADYLTSKPINLNFPKSDSIYFSFFYQPQGNGNAPEYMDSLVLQFRAAGDSTHFFENVWARKGTTLSASDSSWTLVMIPITDSAYLQKGFQFRFKNYATLSGNTDHWNVDYVYLNRLRSKVDTAFSDISFVYNGTPLLKNYIQMPWEQFKKSELRDSVTNLLRYDDVGTPIPVSYGHQVTEDLPAPAVLSNFFSGGTFNVLPYENTHTYTACDFPLGCLKRVAVDTTTFPYPGSGAVAYPLTSPSVFTIKHFIGASNLNPENDTLRVHQNFIHSYAYDDGTAENSFGMSTFNAEIAEKFTLNKPDSLYFIDIFFNPFLVNTSVYTFYLKVWADGGGVPGFAVYTSSTTLSPAYGGVFYNEFIRYKLDAPLYLNAGNYYFGLQQNTDQFLNIGVDKNNNHQDKIFYNVTGTWYTSPLTGSLMLHPVFGVYTDFLTGISDQESVNGNMLSIYPNPATDELYIRSQDGMLSEKTTYTITDMLGRTIVATAYYTHPIDISDLKEGIYFIQIKEGSELSTHKFIKSK